LRAWQSAHLDVYPVDGEHPHADTDLVIGYPDNPMSWDDLYAKFEGLVEPVLGIDRTTALFECLRHFDRAGSLATAMPLLGSAPHSKPALRRAAATIG
jgi:hypothetical protein